MDGVLVNFRDAVLELINYSLYNKEIFDPFEKKMTEELTNMYCGRKITIENFLKEDSKTPYLSYYMFFLIRNAINLWADLPWNPGGKELWKYLLLNYRNVCILSAPADGKAFENCIRGKCQWITKNLCYPIEKCYFYKKKYIFSNKKSILIDDRKDNVELFRQKGGFAILHKDAKTTILTLQTFFQ